MSKVNVRYNGIGFFGLLTIALVVLKLTNHIDWSWWLVLAPMFIPFGILLIAFMVAFVMVFIIELAKTRRK